MKFYKLFKVTYSCDLTRSERLIAAENKKEAIQKYNQDAKKELGNRFCKQMEEGIKAEEMNLGIWI